MIAAGIIFGKEIVVLLLYGLFVECNSLLLHQPLTKGQIISKAIFVFLTSPKKTTKKI